MSLWFVFFDLRIFVDFLIDSVEFDFEVIWLRRDFECKVELSWME